ncbi:MAG: hypothetical protein WCI88_16170 [Chloroflexota bacterium]
MKKLLLLATVLALTACGGGGGGDAGGGNVSQSPAIKEPPKSENDPVLTEIESNNSKEQSNLLTVGKTISGAINIAGDVDWFKIQSSGGIYTINAGVNGVYRASSGLKWVVTVYDENISQVFSFDVDQEHLVSANINLSTPGNYYISTKLNYASGSNNDPYYLAITSQ